MRLTRPYKAVMPVLIMLSACTTAKSSADNESLVSKGTKHLTVLKAVSQKTLPGAPNSEPQTNYHFIVVWGSKEAPETFYWKGKDGWLPCRIMKATQAAQSNSGKSVKSAGDDFRYTTTAIDIQNVTKGDTLELYPLQGKSNLNDNIDSDITNSIFFKTTNSKWLYAPVNNITRKPDIAMP